jgi:predicted DsbA family dithiol-disulfide isomerase
MTDSAVLRITEFTDPGCPFAWSAEPARARVDYLFGEQLEWCLRLVGLSDQRRTRESGYDAEAMSGHMRRLAREFGMPIDARVREFGAATVPACRTVAAAKVRRPRAARRVLRRLRERNWAGEMLDDAATLHGAAEDAGITAEELDAWLEDPAVDETLQEDMRRARHPTPAALALDHKLAGWTGGRRYTCPSWEIERVSDGTTVTVPGFQPLAAYEVALANLAPDLERRAAAESAREVLEWRGAPLATQEVATVLGRDPFEVREELARVAELEPVGADGFWHLAHN